MTALSLSAAHEVDRYLVDTLVGRDDALEAAVAAQRAADMPAIEVAPTGGKLLWLLARLSGARACSRSARSGDTRRSGWLAASRTTVGS
jgi:predicted O-methyltransferase YrrM